MKKNKQRRRLRWISVAMVFAIGIAVFASAGEWMKLRELQDKQAYYAAVYENLQNENAELNNTLSLLNDETYMERLARERFKLIKPNEYLVLPAETNDEVEAYAGVDKSNLH